MRRIYIILLLLSGFSIQAQLLDPVSWDYEIMADNAKIGDELEIRFKAMLEDTWQLYSNKQNYDLGPLPASFEFAPNVDYELIGTVEPIDPKTKYEDVFDVYVNYFEGTAEFRQKVKIFGPDPVIRGSVEYQVCTTVDGKCINLEEDFEFRIMTMD